MNSGTRLSYCNWRASEVSETLSGLFNRESRIYNNYIIYNYLTVPVKRVLVAHLFKIELLLP